MKFIKRDGSLVEKDLSKIHKMTYWMCEGISNVSQSEIEMSANLQFADKMKTTDIQKTLYRAAADLISARTPNYQYVAARGLLTEIRKEVWGQYEPKPLIETIKKNIKLGKYENIFDYYTEDEVNYFGSKIKYERDLLYTYAGMRTVLDSYTMKENDIPLETPQEINMLVSMTLFKNEQDIILRKNLIIDYYNKLSTFEISLPSPFMSGLRTQVKGYSSCCLIDVGDSRDSLNAANAASITMSTIRAGIGLFCGNVRGIGASVARNTIKHTGITPILKWYEAAVRAFSQPSRGGAATVYTACWNWEIEKIINLKSNKSTDEDSVKKLDYGVGFPNLFFDRVSRNEEWTLFSAEETRDLFENLTDEELWNKTYIDYENNKSIRKKKINARQLLKDFAIQYFETGRIYPLFLTNVNKGPIKKPIKMSNLCAEILLYVKELTHLYDENGEIALCILTNINAGKIKSLDELDNLAKLIVRGLDNVIDIQDYPLPAAKNSAVNNRYLGIGASDWSHYLTKHKVRYDSQEALDLAEEFAEKWQFALIKASNELAIERGECKNFRERSKYADGWLPNDGKWRFIPKENWERLRESVVKYGMRHIVLSAIPPAACQSKDSVIKTCAGDKSLKDIMVEQDINFNSLEADGTERWVEFKNTIQIPTRYGDKNVNRIYFNGKKPTKIIEFEDGKTYEFTLNHKLLCIVNGTEQWVEVKNITEEMEVLCV